MIKDYINNVNADHLFEAFFDSKIKHKIMLSPHGSNRIITRIISDDDHSAIGIFNKNIFENKAFLEFTNHFGSFNLHVPKIYSVSTDLTTYILEDLGDETLFSRIIGSNFRFNDELNHYYFEAIENLKRFQIDAGKSIDFSYCYQFTSFGLENINYDIEYFKERFLFEFCRSGIDHKKLDSEFNELRAELVKYPNDYFLYRDFQSRNIMIKNQELFFIDYQSGRKGPLQYDIASLLFDAKANLPNEFRSRLLEKYYDYIQDEISISKEEFLNSFWYFAIIRILQAFGAYGFLSKVRGKTHFLESIPYAQRNFDYIIKEKFNNKKFTYLSELISKIEHESA